MFVGKERGGGVLCRDGFWTELFRRVEMDRGLKGGWKTGEGVSVCGKGDEFLKRGGGGNGAASPALVRLGLVGRLVLMR